MTPSESSSQHSQQPGEHSPAAVNKSTGKNGWGGMVVYIVLFLVAVVAIEFGSSFFSDDHALMNRPAPEFGLLKHDQSGSVRLSDFRGRIVLLDFWATWCPPCRKQMPILQALDEDISLNDKIKIVAINTDEPNEERIKLVEGFMNRHNYTMLNLLDNGTVTRLYGIRGVPTLVVIDRSGNIRQVSTGSHSERQIRQYIAEVDQY